jgi:hypothetical protein
MRFKVTLTQQDEFLIEAASREAALGVATKAEDAEGEVLSVRRAHAIPEIEEVPADALEWDSP